MLLNYLKFVTNFRSCDETEPVERSDYSLFMHINCSDLISILLVSPLQISHYMLLRMQVFPLVIDKFSPEEQCQLVWQYMCSVPTILLEEFFPWMTLHLTPDEKLGVLYCVKLIVPKERLLQEVDSKLRFSS